MPHAEAMRRAGARVSHEALSLEHRNCQRTSINDANMRPDAGKAFAQMVQRLGYMVHWTAGLGRLGWRPVSLGVNSCKKCHKLRSLYANRGVTH